MASTSDEEEGTLRGDQSELLGEGFSFSGYERDSLRLRMADGSFVDISGVSGVDSVSDGRAAVFADFDNDGDLDIFRTSIQGQAHYLFRNNVGHDAHWLRVALVGDDSTGRDAFGTVVRTKTSAGTQTKIKSGGTGYLSQHDPRLLFGLGADDAAETIQVTWPDGKSERFDGPIAAGSSVELQRGTGQVKALRLETAQLPDPLTPGQRFARDLHVKPGQPAPEIPVTTAPGESTTLSALVKPNRLLLVNVWATWCTPCAAEIPELDKLAPAFAERGIDLVGLSVDTDGEAEEILEYAETLGAHYPILLGGVSAIQRIFATDELTVPFSFILDEKGNVTELIPGWSARTRLFFKALAQSP